MDIKKMKQEMEEELVSNILPFWINRMTDEVNGGFYGRITGREEVKPEAEKGAIL
ncbi:MAG: N-acyl-D-glucosamine 2-epimerase, partial [Bacteroides sp.]|nr:N-acyl-D-glucosamine 2-epimerase [Bacteroides sp.]